MKTIKGIGTFLLCFAALSALAVQSSQCARTATTKWTFMVYMDADNNLDAYAPYSLGMMQEIGSTQSVNVVVLWDGFYTSTCLYKVVKGGVEEVNGFVLNGEEANMGDSATLEVFVDFTLRKFPAEHYVLVLWDHGNDVSGICWDEHPEDNLTHPEVAMALSGHHIDILATDACLMAMVEVAYEYNQLGLNTDYFVGSENYVPVNGYPYNTILEALDQNPTMSELESVQMITSYFAEFYKPRAHFSGGVMATLSAIELAMMDDVVSSLSGMTAALMENIEANHEMISTARGEGMLPWSEYGWDQYVDMPTFVETIILETANSDIEDAASMLLSRLEDAVVALGNTEPMDSASAKGMGIWFPPSYHATWGLSTYTATRFAAQGWLDFLCAYWNDGHA